MTELAVFLQDEAMQLCELIIGKADDVQRFDDLARDFLSQILSIYTDSVIIDTQMWDHLCTLYYDFNSPSYASTATSIPGINLNEIQIVTGGWRAVVKSLREYFTHPIITKMRTDWHPRGEFVFSGVCSHVDNHSIVAGRHVEGGTTVITFGWVQDP